MQVGLAVVNAEQLADVCGHDETPLAIRRIVFCISAASNFIYEIPMLSKTDRVSGLDGVRAMCVLLVFIEHFVLHGRNLGGLGVNIFFALSGYLIIGILHGQRLVVDQGMTNPIEELKAFWIGRILRIFPIYYAVLIFIFIGQMAAGSGSISNGLLYYFVFLGNYYIQNVSHGWGSYTHLWSLSVEQHFYILVSSTLLLTTARWHLLVVFGLFVSSVGIAVLDFLNWDGVPRPYLADMPNFSFMACGGLLALTKLQSAKKIVAAGVFLVAVLLFFSINFDGIFFAPGGLRASILWAASLGICFGVLAYVPHAKDSLVVQFLEFGPICYIGTISYGFYIYHYFIPEFALQAYRFTYVPHTLAMVALPVIQFGFTCFLAALSWRLIEQPLLGLKPRLLRDSSVQIQSTGKYESKKSEGRTLPCDD